MSSIDKDYDHYDMNGVNLKVGDKVLFTYDNTSSIYSGIITGFSKRYAVIDKYSNRQPNTLLKI